MKKNIEVFVGSVNNIKVGDMILIKSLLTEVTEIKRGTFNIKISAMTNEGQEKFYTFGKEVFLNI